MLLRLEKLHLILQESHAKAFHFLAFDAKLFFEVVKAVRQFLSFTIALCCREELLLERHPHLKVFHIIFALEQGFRHVSSKWWKRGWKGDVLLVQRGRIDRKAKHAFIKEPLHDG